MWRRREREQASRCQETMSANAARDFGLQTVLVDLVHDVFAHAGKIISLEIGNGQEKNALQLAERLWREHGGREWMGRRVDGRDRGRRETHRGDIGREKHFVLVDDIHPTLRVVVVDVVVDVVIDVVVFCFAHRRARRQGNRRSLGSFQGRPWKFRFGGPSDRKAPNLPLIHLWIIAPHRVDMEKLVQLTRGVAHDPRLDGFGQQLAIPSNQLVRGPRWAFVGRAGDEGKCSHHHAKEGTPRCVRGNTRSISHRQDSR